MTSKRNSFLLILSLILFCSYSITANYDLSSLLTSHEAAFQIKTDTANGAFGTQVSNAGDINKDGYEDILIAAPVANKSKGEVYIIYGGPDLSASGLADFNVNSLDPSTTGFKISGEAGWNNFGASASAAGDIDNDGYADIIIGALRKGTVYVIFGRPTAALQHIDLSTTSLALATTGFTIKGNAPDDRFGYAVCGAGDINKDGYADFIIGAPNRNGNTGAAYVIYGGPRASFSAVLDLSVTTLNPATTGFTITGNASGDMLGTSVGAAGRINNDEYDDIIVGASGPESQQGAVYIIYGAQNFPSSYTSLGVATLNPSTTGFKIMGRQSGDMFGSSCGNAGDIDGDGKNDIFVAAKQRNNNQGEVYIIYGQVGPFFDIYLSSTTLVPDTTGFLITGEVVTSAIDGFGSSIASAGDVNGDGFGDIIIGAPSKNMMYVIYGGEKNTRKNIPLASTDFDPLENGFAMTGPTRNPPVSGGPKFGTSVSAAKSFKLDGKAGLLVGATDTSSNGDAFVIFPSKLCANACLSCTQMDTCTQCDTTLGYGLENSICKLCPAGKYSSIGTGPCNECPTGCSSCSAGSSGVTCTACKSGYFSVASTSGNCEPCPAGCTECSSSSFCTACSNGLHLANNKCCPLSCSQCSSSSVCTVCNNGLGLIGNECKTCPDQTYLAAGACLTCPVLCAKCINPSMCTSCVSGMVLFNSECRTSCPTGYFNSSGVCQTCASAIDSCSECSSSSICTSCSGGKLVYNSQCVGLCPLVGFYPVSGKCEPCDSSCAICLGSALACTSCPSGKFLFGYSCRSECPTGFYPVNGECKPCDGSCLTCAGSASFCTTCPGGKLLLKSSCVFQCPTGFYQKDGKCESCPSSCASCSEIANQVACISCVSGSGLYMDQCMNPCPDGTYLAASGRCEDCSLGCAQCTGSSVCTACENGYGLIASQCLDPCPDGTYLTNGKCDSCPGTCTKCTDFSHCTACGSGYGLVEAQCIVCPMGAYLKGEQCLDCPVGCSKCSSHSVCQACHKGYALSDAHLCEEEEVDNTREKTAGDAFEGSSIAGAALASGSSLPINFGLVAKIIRNLKYLNVTVSTELQATFRSWKVNNGFLKAPKAWSSESHSKPLPGVFRRYGLDPVFLVNYWKPLIMTLIGFVLFGAFKIMEIGLGKNNSFLRKLNVAASNFALTQIYSSLDDVIFYFVLDARSTEFDSAFQGFSLALAVIFLLIGCVILVLHGFLLKKYQSLKRQKTQTNLLKRFLYQYENVKLIFQDFKDTSLITQSFLWIHIVRALISSLIFTILFEYPLVQALLLLILNIGMIVFILLENPFKETLSTFSQLFCEIILFLANICMLVMAIFDQAGSSPTGVIEFLSTSVIILNAILLFGSAILMVLGIVKDLYRAYTKKKKGIPANLKDNRMDVNFGNTSSDKFQQNSSADFTRNIDHEPRQNYSEAANKKVTLYDLNTRTNVQNKLDISDLSYDTNSKPSRGHLNNYQGKYLESNFENTIDETMMNTSNVDLLQERAGSFSRPKIRGKIKMPRGVQVNPRSMNDAIREPPGIQYNNLGPTNMETLNPNKNRSGFGSQLRTSELQRNGSFYEEFILERTRARMKYHNARTGRFHIKK